MLATAVISYDISDLVGNDFDARRTKVWVTTNVPGDTLVDTVGNQIRLGDGVGTIDETGTGSVSVWVPGTGSNPASWQTYIHVDYARRQRSVREVRVFGPFTVTADANLADLIQEQEIPPDYQAGVFAEIEAFVDQAEAAAEAAVDISGISTSDGVVEALVKGTAGAGPLTRAALAARYASPTEVLSRVSTSTKRKGRPFPGVLVGGRNFQQTDPLSGTSVGQYTTHRSSFDIKVDCSDIVAVFENKRDTVGDTAPPNDVVITKVALEIHPAGYNGTNGVIVPMFFNNGSRSATVTGFASVATAPCGVELKAGDVVSIRTYIDLGGATGQFVANGNNTNRTGSPWYEGRGAGDLADSGTIAATVAYIYAPTLLLGTPRAGMPPQFGFIGDSISYGVGDTPAAQNTGFIVRGFEAAGVCYQARGRGGARGYAYIQPGAHHASARLFNGCTHMLWQFGANDYVAGTTSLSELQSWTLAGGTLFGARGIAMWAQTLMPRNTSTDSWATLANQTQGVATPNPNAETVRVAYNGWVRDGMPVDSTTLVAVAVGTSVNVLRVGEGLHPFAGWLEIADAVESSRNSGKWKVTGAANYGTIDGVHPTAVLHAAAGAVVQAWAAAVKTAWVTVA